MEERDRWHERLTARIDREVEERAQVNDRNEILTGQVDLAQGLMLEMHEVAHDWRDRTADLVAMAAEARRLGKLPKRRLRVCVWN